MHEIGGIGRRTRAGGDMKKALSAGIGSILLRKPTLCLIAPRIQSSVVQEIVDDRSFHSTTAMHSISILNPKLNWAPHTVSAGGLSGKNFLMTSFTFWNSSMS